MVKLDEKMKGMLRDQLAYLATVGEAGIPNLAPKGTLRVLDDETLWFIEVAGKKTFENLRKNPNVSVVIADRQKRDGYQCKGTAEILSEGPLFDEAVKMCKERGFPTPRAAVKIKLSDIYSHKVGPEAGKKSLKPIRFIFLI